MAEDIKTEEVTIEEVTIEETKPEETNADQVKAEEVKPAGTTYRIVTETAHHFLQTPDGAISPMTQEDSTGLYVSGELSEATARLMATVPNYALREEVPPTPASKKGK